MAKWNIEQKTEVWYRTEVEADTFEEAIANANDAGDWYRNDDSNWLNEYWGENTENELQYSQIDGMTEEEI